MKIELAVYWATCIKGLSMCQPCEGVLSWCLSNQRRREAWMNHNEQPPGKGESSWQKCEPVWREATHVVQTYSISIGRGRKGRYISKNLLPFSWVLRLWLATQTMDGDCYLELIIVTMAMVAIRLWTSTIDCGRWFRLSRLDYGTSFPLLNA